MITKRLEQLINIKLLVFLIITFLSYTAYQSLSYQKITSSYTTTPLHSTTQLNQPALSSIALTDSVSALNTSDQDKQFEIIIPKIGIDKQVIPNVDPTNEAIYGPLLIDYVAHGEYTKLPDEAISNGNVYLFAHREGFLNGHQVGYFQNINQLGNGDQVIIKFAGRIYTYSYLTNFIITPNDTWVYTGVSDLPTLTLQTCENGTTQRLIVKLKLISVS